jgi:hypothetical protein
MMLQKIKLTIALAIITAFVTAAIRFNPGGHAETAIRGKRPDHTVPAGGFRPRQQNSGALSCQTATPDDDACNTSPS